MILCLGSSMTSGGKTPRHGQGGLVSGYDISQEGQSPIEVRPESESECVIRRDLASACVLRCSHESCPRFAGRLWSESELGVRVRQMVRLESKEESKEKSKGKGTG